jgi:hypothetical protein
VQFKSIKPKALLGVALLAVMFAVAMAWAFRWGLL